MRRRQIAATNELDFQAHVLLAVGTHRSFRVHRQNVGSVPVRDARGKIVRVFHAGPPTGASDVSGIVIPEGWRLELEFKSATGTRSAAQIHWSEHIVRAGGVYALIAYDDSRTLQQNIVDAVHVIESAIARRRAAA